MGNHNLIENSKTNLTITCCLRDGHGPEAQSNEGNMEQGRQEFSLNVIQVLHSAADLYYDLCSFWLL